MSLRLLERLPPRSSGYDYRDYLKRVVLEFRGDDSLPSIQLADWCERKLPPGTYLVRWRHEDENFEIYTGGESGGALIATWPDPGVMGAPKAVPVEHRHDQPERVPDEGVMVVDLDPPRGGVQVERSAVIAALDVPGGPLS
jgi:hypothetical protein